MVTSQTEYRVSEADLRSSLLSALDELCKPLSVTQLRSSLPKAFRRSTPELTTHLDALVAQGQAFATVSGKSRVYTRHDPCAAAERIVLSELARGPATPARLKQMVADTGFKDLAGLLTQLVAARQLHPRYKPTKSGALGKSVEAYVLGPPPPPPPPPKELAEPAILSVLSGGGRSPADLKKLVTGRVPKLKPAELQQTLARLVQESRVHIHRKRNNSGTPSTTIVAYALDPEPVPDAALFISQVQKALGQAVEVAGAQRVSAPAVLAALVDASSVDLDELFRELERRRGIKLVVGRQHDGPALGSSDDRQKVLSALKELVRRERLGALIPVRALRRATELGPNRFDAAVLGLAQDDAVILHHHAQPNELPDGERAELVQDRYGTYYVGVALSRGAS